MKFDFVKMYVSFVFRGVESTMRRLLCNCQRIFRVKLSSTWSKDGKDFFDALIVISVLIFLRHQRIQTQRIFCHQFTIIGLLRSTLQR